MKESLKALAATMLVCFALAAIFMLLCYLVGVGIGIAWHGYHEVVAP